MNKLKMIFGFYSVLKAMRQDALRYRWLRKHIDSDPADLDAAVDLAMKKESLV